MTSDEIRIQIDKLRTLTTGDRGFRPAMWLPAWEIAYQLAVHNEREALDSDIEKVRNLSERLEALEVWRTEHR